MYEAPDGTLYIRLQIPGVSPEDVDISISKGKKEEKQGEEATHILQIVVNQPRVASGLDLSDVLATTDILPPSGHLSLEYVLPPAGVTERDLLEVWSEDPSAYAGLLYVTIPTKKSMQALS